MSVENKRDFDIVVFGASGYTGQYVIEELASHTEGINWSVAGRSEEKLIRILRDLGISTDGKIIQADVSSQESIDEMCKKTKLIINCVGPYRFYGEQVVAACVRNGTHHVDVSGEPQFLESMQLKYFDEAKSKNIYIVGSCGFDSIPCDVGIEVFKQRFNGELDCVETFLKTERPPGSTVNFATWQSAIYGLAHAYELLSLRKDLKVKLFNKKMPTREFPLKKRSVLFNSKDAGGWCVPFIGSDRSVILRSQMYNYQYKNERPIQVQTYMKSFSLLYALATLLMGAVFMFMTKFVYGRDLLEKFPELFSFGVFSKNPPSKEKNSACSFELVFKGRGWTEKLTSADDRHSDPPNRTETAVLKGPDPGYITTAICVVSSALVVLQESDKMPDVGGVFTPGSAFSGTTLMERLEKRGIVMTLENEMQSKM